MKLKKILDFTNKYLDSYYYLTTLFVLSFLMWILPLSFNFVFGIFYCMLSFLPLFYKDGKHYLPLILFTFPSSSTSYDLNSIQVITYFIYGSIILSMIIKIISQKLTIRKGIILFPLLILFSLFSLSYLINIVFLDNYLFNFSGIYLLFLFITLLIYILCCSTLGLGPNINYYSFCVAVFSFLIVLEGFINLAINLFDVTKIDLGWADTTKLSIMLIFCLPFYSILISDRNRWYFIFPFLFVFSVIVLLFVNSSIFILMIIFIPLIIFTFRNYNKLLPYITLLFSFLFVSLTLLLLIFNEDFASIISNSIKDLFFLKSSNSYSYLDKNNIFSVINENLVIGKSISFLFDENKFVSTSSNILDIMICGGIIGIISYLSVYISIYYLCFKKKANYKYLYFMLFIIIQLIGINHKIMFDFDLLMFCIISIICYQYDNVLVDIPVHNDFYKNYNIGHIKTKTIINN